MYLVSALTLSTSCTGQNQNDVCIAIAATILQALSLILTTKIRQRSRPQAAINNNWCAEQAIYKKAGDRLHSVIAKQTRQSFGSLEISRIKTYETVSYQDNRDHYKVGEPDL